MDLYRIVGVDGTDFVYPDFGGRRRVLCLFTSKQSAQNTLDAFKRHYKREWDQRVIAKITAEEWPSFVDGIYRNGGVENIVVATPITSEPGHVTMHTFPVADLKANGYKLTFPETPIPDGQHVLKGGLDARRQS